MSETEYTVALANKVLDRADRFGAVDPDGDLAVLARQFLRAREKIDKLVAEIKLLRSVSGFVEVKTFREITKELPRNESKPVNG